MYHSQKLINFLLWFLAKAKASKKLTGGKSTKKDVLFKVIDDDDVESVTEEDIKELTEKVKLSWYMYKYLAIEY